MLLTRHMATALLQMIRTPRSGTYRLHNGRVYVRDKADGTYRAVVLKDGVISTGETL